jgi:hypothetical protein
MKQPMDSAIAHNFVNKETTSNYHQLIKGKATAYRINRIHLQILEHGNGSSNVCITGDHQRHNTANGMRWLASLPNGVITLHLDNVIRRNFPMQ